jgi:hypothetical protein
MVVYYNTIIERARSPEMKNPVAERALKRRQEWEAERLSELRQKVEGGLITEAEAAEKGLPAYSNGTHAA